MVKAEKIGDREIKFTFDAPGNRELPLIVGQLTILPKHWWEGTDGEGRKRDISSDDAGEAAGLGSLPDQGVRRRTIGGAGAGEGLLGRAISAPISGSNNFDELRYEYFRDSTVALEAFKGDQRGLAQRKQRQELGRPPTISRRSSDKRVMLEEFPNRNSGLMQAFAINLRRDKFRDRGCAAP